MTYTPMTPVEAEEKIRRLAHRLLAAIDEQQEAALALADARANYNACRLKASLQSRDQYGKERTTDHHNDYAEHEAVDLYRVMVAAEAIERSVREEMHSLRQVLSSLQTNARAMQTAGG
jgi:hypothetical protein